MTRIPRSAAALLAAVLAWAAAGAGSPAASQAFSTPDKAAGRRLHAAAGGGPHMDEELAVARRMSDRELIRALDALIQERTALDIERARAGVSEPAPVSLREQALQILYGARGLGKRR